MAEHDNIAQALRKAFNLGQRYWQQADSDSYIQHKKADKTLAEFDQLVAEVCAQAAPVPAVPKYRCDVCKDSGIMAHSHLCAACDGAKWRDELPTPAPLAAPAQDVAPTDARVEDQVEALTWLAAEYATAFSINRAFAFGWKIPAGADAQQDHAPSRDVVLAAHDRLANAIRAALTAAQPAAQPADAQDMARLVEHAAYLSVALRDDDSHAAVESWRSLPQHLQAAITAQEESIEAERTEDNAS